jgi:hypothetical protein
MKMSTLKRADVLLESVTYEQSERGPNLFTDS